MSDTVSEAPPKRRCVKTHQTRPLEALRAGRVKSHQQTHAGMRVSEASDLSFVGVAGDSVVTRECTGLAGWEQVRGSLTSKGFGDHSGTSLKPLRANRN